MHVSKWLNVDNILRSLGLPFDPEANVRKGKWMENDGNGYLPGDEHIYHLGNAGKSASKAPAGRRYVSSQ